MTLRRAREADNSVWATLGVPVTDKRRKTDILEGRIGTGGVPYLRQATPFIVPLLGCEHIRDAEKGAYGTAL